MTGDDHGAPLVVGSLSLFAGAVLLAMSRRREACGRRRWSRPHGSVDVRSDGSPSTPGDDAPARVSSLLGSGRFAELGPGRLTERGIGARPGPTSATNMLAARFHAAMNEQAFRAAVTSQLVTGLGLSAGAYWRRSPRALLPHHPNGRGSGTRRLHARVSARLLRSRRGSGILGRASISGSAAHTLGRAEAYAR